MDTNHKMTKQNSMKNTIKNLSALKKGGV